MRLFQLKHELEAHGLVLRGAFEVEPEDHVPPIAHAIPAAALVLVGNVGSSLWPQFAASPEYCDGRRDPLDRWSQRIGEALAARYGARALYPFGGPPHYPFQRWASRAESVHPSPLGLVIHAEYGSWHAYRFALALDHVPDDLAPMAEHESPCLGCAERACLDACPVDAFTGSEYRIGACAQHLRDMPDGACMRLGCAARRACLVGAPSRYDSQHAAFHMQAFVFARSSE
ncbi:hypothetical protein HOP62_13260 [Halomonas sp. MCCC 1A17488]|jgi:ferredoxin|uniref:4Fe-4S ferredoxin-type domain-containing protein n=2 Tax=Billgrantia TaxID=3137761 RepID=A0A6I6SM87_9GAMM|nr:MULTISPECIES: hypothetical protein [Halomonas]MDX5434345.1 hypothetical protein [Halomonas sp.]MCE8017040.1 hypothetical protein [Halomonas sp. MCCC 1A17488]MCE8035015.1 hypothetical protein [Halomonas sp. MCCC 1A11057]MCG3240373.1 hypothetical protein [Halomonas sp. MCCC 1A17488]QHC48475.1 hypothetical protein EKK97_01125 [Halomonas tianxiuensis]